MRYLSTNEDRVKTNEIFTTLLYDTPIQRSVFTTVGVIFGAHGQKIKQKLRYFPNLSRTLTISINQSINKNHLK